VNADDDELSNEPWIRVDNHNNVVANNDVDDERSDQDSIDIDKLIEFPKPRYKIKENDSDSRYSDAYT